MRLWSSAWSNGEPMPPRLAAVAQRADGRWGAGQNLSPPLAWSDLPAGTRSLALLCHDFDMPADAAGAAAQWSAAFDSPPELAADLPRVDGFHWVLVDIPPQLTGFAEGQWRQGLAAGDFAGLAPGGADPGQSAAAAPTATIRQGLNDVGPWLAGLDGPARLDAPPGPRLGYDGPCPPPGDALVHHYLFALYALRTAKLPLPDGPGGFTGRQVLEALAGQVLDAATLSGTYTLNRRLWPAG